MKRILGLIMVLMLVAAACGGNDETAPAEDDGATATTAAPADDGGGDDGDKTATTEAPPATSDAGAAQPSGGTLDEVLGRGSLRCGVSTTAIGFSEPQDDGTHSGFDADYCRLVAAALFGDAEAVDWVPLTAAERFTALANGEVDVLFRNTTWTQSRDSEIGGDFGPTTFYDGQQLMGKSAFGFTDGSPLVDMDGARACTNAGTTTEKNITEAANVLGIAIELVTTEDFAQSMQLFREGSCDIVTTDGSGLFGERFAAIGTGEIAEGEWVIFPTSPISKEPLGPMYRQNDSFWADVIDWVVYASFYADELGIGQANIDAMIAAPPTGDAGRMLGATEDELQTALGLSADAFANAIRLVGNYNDIYERNLIPLGFDRAGTPNATWLTGGLLYAPPFH